MVLHFFGGLNDEREENTVGSFYPGGWHAFCPAIGRLRR
jgi:hypothetical protein